MFLFLCGQVYEVTIGLWLLQFNQKGEMNECNKHLTQALPVIWSADLCPNRNKLIERSKERLYDSYFKEEQLDSQGTISLCPSNIYLGIA